MFKIILSKKYRKRIQAFESAIAALSRMMVVKDRTISEQYMVISQQENIIRALFNDISLYRRKLREADKNKLPRDARGRFVKRK